MILLHQIRLGSAFSVNYAHTTQELVGNPLEIYSVPISSDILMKPVPKSILNDFLVGQNILIK